MLTETVPNLGEPGDIVKVKAGYARNYLLPHGLGTAPSDQMLRQLEKHKVKLTEIADKKAADLQKLGESLGRQSVSIEANANNEGHLYGSVTQVEIASALSDAGFSIAPEQIRLEGPLKELGLYTIQVHLDGDVGTEVKVWVVPSSEGEGA
ncbi:MAG: 50S ribosomal protein L9 [Planctomycetota bacterium]|nr:50S ribosomal protein L9 [Planctomycetota bacterium]